MCSSRILLFSLIETIGQSFVIPVEDAEGVEAIIQLFLAKLDQLPISSSSRAFLSLLKKDLGLKSLFHEPKRSEKFKSCIEDIVLTAGIYTI